MKLNSGRWLEDRCARRYSLHTFRWGFHLKRRRGTVWSHFVVKLGRGSVFGQNKARGMLWIGWWESRRGQRKHLNGYRIVLAVDRLPKYPPDTITIPFFPQGDDRSKRQRRNDRRAACAED